MEGWHLPKRLELDLIEVWIQQVRVVDCSALHKVGLSPGITGPGGLGLWGPGLKGFILEISQDL